MNRIDPGRAKQSRQIGLRARLALGKGRAFPLVAGVNLNHFAGLGIVQYQPAKGGEFELITIGNLHRHDIMTPIGLAQHGKGGLRQ